MDNQKNNLIVGGFLILLGGLILLNNLGFIYFRDELFLSLIFAGFGIYLLTRYAQSGQMGTLIFSAIFLFVATAIFVDSTRIIDTDWMGTLFFWGAGLLFAVPYTRNRDKWGLALVAGVLFTLGSVVLVNTVRYFDHDLGGGTFFLGLGLTFGFLYLTRDENNKLNWAGVPAALLILFAGVVYFATTDSVLANLLLPATFIALGGYLVLRSQQSRPINKTV